MKRKLMLFQGVLLLGILLKNIAIEAHVASGYELEENNFWITVNEGPHYIQPEGITNLAVEIIINSEVKDMRYRIDFGSLKHKALDRKFIMNYDLVNAVVRIREMDVAGGMVEKNIGCIVDKPDENDWIEILLQGMITAGSKYRVDIYIPTRMGSGITYGGAEENTYLGEVIGKEANKKTMVSGKFSAKVKVEEGTSYEEIIGEQYREVEISKEMLLTYLEIAKIN